MLWKRIAALARRLRMVKLALRGQQGMSQLCRLFGVSRRTGYKWRGRFEREGMRGLRDRSHRPHRSPQQLGVRWWKRVQRLRRRHRRWGSRKLAAALGREYRRGQVPSARTIDYWLRRLHGTGRRPRRSRLGPPLRRGALTLAQPSVDGGF